MHEKNQMLILHCVFVCQCDDLTTTLSGWKNPPPGCAAFQLLVRKFINLPAASLSEDQRASQPHELTAETQRCINMFWSHCLDCIQMRIDAIPSRYQASEDHAQLFSSLEVRKVYWAQTVKVRQSDHVHKDSCFRKELQSCGSCGLLSPGMDCHLGA